MPTLSKSASRKRLNEATRKMLVVWNGRHDALTKGDLNKLLKAVEMVDDVAKNLNEVIECQN